MQFALTAQALPHGIERDGVNLVEVLRFPFCFVEFAQRAGVELIELVGGFAALGIQARAISVKASGDRQGREQVNEGAGVVFGDFIDCRRGSR